MRNCTIVSSHLAIFSPGSTCVTEPHWCCGCCCRDHCSHALIGGPSVVCIIVCRTGSVLYTFSSNQAGSAAVCTVTWGQKLSQSIYNNFLWMGPSIWIFVTFQQFVLEQNSKHMYYVWTRIFSALNSCQIRKNRLYTLLHVMKFYILTIFYITAIIFSIRLHTL